MAHHGCRIDVEMYQQIANGRCMRGERVIPGRLVGAAVTEQVWGDNPIFVRQALDLAGPRLVRAEQTSNEKVRLHDARHSCGSLMHMRNVPTVVIAAWLGHSSAAFTMATYIHSQDDALLLATQSFQRDVTTPVTTSVRDTLKNTQ